jgi:hypothetical protein
MGYAQIAGACLALAAGCHSLKVIAPLADRQEKANQEAGFIPSNQRSFRVEQFVFSPDFEVNAAQPLFRELGKLRDQVYKELQLAAVDTLIHVYLFENRETYKRFIKAKYPDLPDRRAFFVAQPHGVDRGEDLLVYTFWGDRVQQDLRHELTHALLHSVLKDVPLWLDEGLAEYFELPPESNGLNVRHLEQTQPGALEPFTPDLAKLEQLSQVQQMTPAEYREAWAWVHLMLRGRPEAKTVLVDYLQQLRVNRNPGLLRPRLVAVFPNVEQALTQHLVRLEPERRRTPSAGALVPQLEERYH